MRDLLRRRRRGHRGRAETSASSATSSTPPSRLQTAAPPGEILIDADTAAMVRAAGGIEPVPPLRLKGKAQPVPAWRVTQPIRAEDDAPRPG